jgi:hypothetical protein
VRAAEQLLREGKRPTVAAVREKVGGSPSTVAPHLDGWWRALGKRVAQGPEAFERIPAALVDVVESLWLETLTEARSRAREGLSLPLAGDNERHDKPPAASRASSYRDLQKELLSLIELLRQEQSKLSTAARRLVALQRALSSRR